MITDGTRLDELELPYDMHVVNTPTGVEVKVDIRKTSDDLRELSGDRDLKKYHASSFALGEWTFFDGGCTLGQVRDYFGEYQPDPDLARVLTDSRRGRINPDFFVGAA